MRNFIWIFIVSTVLISGCSKDDEPVNQAELDLVGEWTAKEFSLGLTINGTPFLEWLEEETDLSESEIELFVDLLIEGFSAELSGTIEFFGDHTFLSQFGSDPEESGTWLLTNNNETLTITNSNNESSIWIVITLTSTTLMVGLEETDSDDLDGDGTDEDIVTSIELTFEK